MKQKYWLPVIGALLAAFSLPASAQQAGDWFVRAGAWTVSPKSNNSAVANVDDGYSMGFNATYMFTDRFAVEVLASLPFSHDITLAADGSKVGETRHLPPTFTAQYYFPVSETVRVYGGVGVNWTIFFEEETTGALTGSKLELEDSVGLALQLGADFDIAENWFANVDVRYVDIETDAKLDGADLTTVKIDPWVVGLNLGWRF